MKRQLSIVVLVCVLAFGVVAWSQQGRPGNSVPNEVVYIGANVSDALRGLTASNPSGSQYALDVNVSAMGGSTFTADAVEDAGVATPPVPVGGVYRTASVTLDNGDVGYLRLDADNNLYVRTVDPCAAEAKTYYTVDTATAGTLEIANAVTSEFFYICSVNLVTNATNAVVIAEDDTDGCGSISAGVTGGTTAAEGWTFAANGGIAVGNGMGAIAKTTTAARYLCILTSASTQLSGVITYVSAP